MRPSYSATIGAPPLLIVDTDTVLDDEIRSSTASSEIPEAIDDELELLNSTTPIITTTPETSTSTTSALITTTVSEITSTLTSDDQTTTPTTSDLKLELKNLPDILSLLKHLSLIPAVVRSFSSAAGADNFGGISTTQQNELRSRALSANSGYSARAPQFVAAPSGESEVPQVF
jgi:hypothetical protein